MSLSPDGKINGKIPVFNDCLSFIWNKSCRCARDPIVKACIDNFNLTEIVDARDLFFIITPEKQGGKRRIKHRKDLDILNGLYAEFQSLPSDSELIFVALDLNKIPTIDLTSIDGVALVHKQAAMSKSIEEIIIQNSHMAKELSYIKRLLPMPQPRPNDAKSSQDISPPIPDATVNVFQAENVPVIQNIDGSGLAAGQTSGNNDRTGRLSVQNQNSFAFTLQQNARQQEHPTGSSPPQPSNATVTDTAERRGDNFEIWDRNRRRKRAQQDKLITGRKTGSVLGAIPKVKKCSIFVSRLNPSIAKDKVKDFVSGIIGGDTCIVEKLQTKFDSYASFYVSCDDKHKDKVLDPDMWESGILVRPFYGSVTAANANEGD